MRLKSKIALITGAAQGIGESIAEQFSKEGACVILTDINDDLGQQASSRIPNSSYYHLDVSDPQQWVSLTETLQKTFGHIDILVNNAGITGLSSDPAPQDPEHMSIENWRAVHQVNLESVFLGCRSAIQLMKTNGGSIINLSSRSGIVGIPRASAYASSKAAIRNFTKSVALYCAEENYPIRCNAICPAAIDTPIWDDMLDSTKPREQAIDEIAKDIPLRKMGEPIDVAYAAVYLASHESKYVTGSEIHVDGGILAGSAASPKKK